MAKEYSRSQRVADQIQRELSLALQREIKDPRLGMVTINAVNVSSDLTNADVYFTRLGGSLGEDNEGAEEAEEILAGAAGFLRVLLAKGMKLRVTPHLRFHYDHSLARGQKLSRLIEEARSRDDDQE